MVTITYLGHSCFLISDSVHTLIIDPFLTGNPTAAAKAIDIKVDYVMVSHGHTDHVGDAVAIARQNNVPIISSFELCGIFEKEGAKIEDLHIGGSQTFPFGRVKLTIAHHGSGYGPDGALIYCGPPVGFVITIGGKTIYHAGDTGLFYDMKLIGELDSIDCALLPIGDKYTMGIDDAARAVEFLNAKAVIPMHYNTWPPIAASPEKFTQAVKARSTAMVINLKPGESHRL